MSVLESLGAAAVIGLLLFGADRGISYHVCLYASIASGGKIDPENIYRKMHNPFLILPKILPYSLTIIMVYYFSRIDAKLDFLRIFILVSLIFCFIIASTLMAFRAFRELR